MNRLGSEYFLNQPFNVFRIHRFENLPILFDDLLQEFSIVHLPFALVFAFIHVNSRSLLAAGRAIRLAEADPFAVNFLCLFVAITPLLGLRFAPSLGYKYFTASDFLRRPAAWSASQARQRSTRAIPYLRKSASICGSSVFPLRLCGFA